MLINQVTYYFAQKKYFLHYILSPETDKQTI